MEADFFYLYLWVGLPGTTPPTMKLGRLTQGNYQSGITRINIGRQCQKFGVLAGVSVGLEN